MRLVLIMLAALSLTGCVTYGTYSSGYYPQRYESRFVGYDEWGRAVYAAPAPRPVVVETVVVPVVVIGRGHNHGRGHRHRHRH